ncbi:hypothetical protein EMIHUDRAFT_100679 [Emiliania huxleyi CCMP1516]|uniref:Uncharacterized protein n=2 Tax=Emiliania huxleyi TaxID=2903 RepID=A0A0D3JQF5_EMIH1|nr:hypothetical protein EMIHUDRAFT_119606 [Emiliania huxleyi CCMP1516]XP_005778169.1 hypothetical protein EMIHUDRAFT_100679 [Emiliania huxleyi CCMP1516]EOD14232.1 hypothetical protein EMIHUDRAFT_119606 [Emiliania huxleyi CCMP1516]EOD25740.1 hypothetical protein EMIHUDRAFT_100679 [Emiliania huxleyi CCMP1516]|eukprot:XP_005766661.1 hypothetical protein EMIHUDRAFT_119606 [Emiliania huxleyi CCMP1516]
MAMQPPPMQQQKHHHHHQQQQHQQSREPLHRRLLQSGSVRTWQGSAHDDQADVSIGTAGRPLDAEVELWEGPLEFPAAAAVADDLGPARPPPANGYEGAALHPGLVVGDSSTSSDRIQGGALRTFRVDAAVASVEVRLLSEGYPIYGAIEVLQGPNTERQVIELYSENGRDRPISYLLETPGFGCVVSVKNTWPSMEYPMTALVLPHVVSPRGWGGWQAGQRRDGYDGVGGRDARLGGFGDGYGGAGAGGYDPRAVRGMVVPKLQDQRGRGAPPSQAGRAAGSGAYGRDFGRG